MAAISRTAAWPATRGAAPRTSAVPGPVQPAPPGAGITPARTRSAEAGKSRSIPAPGLIQDGQQTWKLASLLPGRAPRPVAAAMCAGARCRRAAVSPRPGQLHGHRPNAQARVGNRRHLHQRDARETNPVTSSRRSASMSRFGDRVAGDILRLPGMCRRAGRKGSAQGTRTISPRMWPCASSRQASRIWVSGKVAAT